MPNPERKAKARENLRGTSRALAVFFSCDGCTWSVESWTYSCACMLVIMNMLVCVHAIVATFTCLLLHRVKYRKVPRCTSVSQNYTAHQCCDGYVAQGGNSSVCVPGKSGIHVVIELCK